MPIAASQLNTHTGLNWVTAIDTIVVAPMILAGLTLGAVTGE